MSSHVQQGHNPSDDLQIGRFRWFLVYLYAIAFILCIIAAVVIAFVTKSVYPGAIPTLLLLVMKPIVKWSFSSQTST